MFFLSRFIPTCVGNIFRGLLVACFDGGSSPRVWGTYDPQVVAVRLHRFIPTCVGNMPAAQPSERGRSVHPHVCGEHFTAICVASALTGSSPRVWGTFLHNLPLPRLQRFIPTCVGNMPRSSSPAHTPSVHPHVCGEHVGGGRYKLGGSRFIPTCVGNIWRFIVWTWRVVVHPHVCGEHDMPTHFRRIDQSVHPHVCGEHPEWRRAIFVRFGSSPRVWGTWLLPRQGRSSGGSSPRVWGTFDLDAAPRLRRRFIPTCVGNMRR